MLLEPGETRQFAVCFTLATAAPAASAHEKMTDTERVALRRASVAADLIGTSRVTASTPTGRGPRVRDETLARVGAPVLFPVPGYVIGTDMSNVSLVVMPPAGTAVASAVSNDPEVLQIASVAPVSSSSSESDVNMTRILLQGLSRGQARIVVTYTDATWQVGWPYRAKHHRH